MVTDIISQMHIKQHSSMITFDEFWEVFFLLEQKLEAITRYLVSREENKVVTTDYDQLAHWHRLLVYEESLLQCDDRT